MPRSCDSSWFKMRIYSYKDILCVKRLPLFSSHLNKTSVTHYPYIWNVDVHYFVLGPGQAQCSLLIRRFRKSIFPICRKFVPQTILTVFKSSKWCMICLISCDKAVTGGTLITISRSSSLFWNYRLTFHWSHTVVYQLIVARTYKVGYWFCYSPLTKT